MPHHIKLVETILYVASQEESTRFYSKLLRRTPDLNVPGMTEFQLTDSFKLGLMPNDGIAKILKNKTPHPATGTGIPRCELYLYVDDIQVEYDNAILTGATPISPIEERNWGDTVCYFADPDGHVVAFAESPPQFKASL